MGITGLLKNLKSITNRIHVKELQGLKIGVDGHGLLHRGSYSCSEKLCENLYTDSYIKFILNILNLLTSNGILAQDIIVVFDGLTLPIKTNKNESRKQNRKDNLQLARDSIDSKEARKYYQRSVSITAEMIKGNINIKY